MKVNNHKYVLSIWYFIPQVSFWIIAGSLLLFLGDKGCFLLLNRIHYPSLNQLILGLREISGGLILVSLYVLKYARTKPGSAILAIVVVFTAWYTCITLKYNFFYNWISPSFSLHESNIHVMKSILQPELNFPSAHAVVIASLFTFIACTCLHSKPELFSFSLLSMALPLTGIYTGWSFLSDVLAGDILGTVTTLVCIPWFASKIERWYYRRSEYWQGMTVAILRTAAISTILVNLKYFNK